MSKRDVSVETEHDCSSVAATLKYEQFDPLGHVKLKTGVLQVYNRLQSGAGLISPTCRTSSGSPKPKQRPQHGQPGSFASVLASGIKNDAIESSCGATGRPRASVGTDFSHTSAAEECYSQHPWLDPSILEARVLLYILSRM